MCAAKKRRLLIDGADLLRSSQLRSSSRATVLRHPVQFDRTIHCTEPVDNRPELEAFKLFAFAAD
jgi:hypothetical protein